MLFRSSVLLGVWFALMYNVPPVGSLFFLLYMHAAVRLTDGVYLGVVDRQALPSKVG